MSACATATPKHVEAPAKKPPPAPATFANVRGWGPLTWDMTYDQARKALDDARIYYELHDNQNAALRGRALSRDLDADMAIDDEPAPRTAVMPRRPNRTIGVTLEDGWQGTIVFGYDERMAAVSLARSELTDEQVKAVEKERQTRYGEPASKSTSPTNDVYQWQNGTTRLVFQVWQDGTTKKWHAQEQWQRLY
jgi:hypothetical protein